MVCHGFAQMWQTQNVMIVAGTDVLKSQFRKVSLCKGSINYVTDIF